MSDEDGKFVIELQGIDKRHLAYVWQKMKNGEELEGQEVFIGRSMADHPQWYPFFTTIGLLEGDDELPDGTNPFAHVTLHVLIGSQIFNQEVPEAETFYRMRLRKGDDSHSVIHMMIEVFQRHLVWAMRHAENSGELNLDMGAYAATLRSLWRLKTKKLWQRLGYAYPPVPHQDEG